MPSIYFKMQSSWTKRAVEIDSPQPMSPNHLSDSPDSTCAQVIHPKSEICSNRLFSTTNKRSSNNQKQNNGTVCSTISVIQSKYIFLLYHVNQLPLSSADDSMGKYLEIGAPGNSSLRNQSSPNEMSVNPTEKQHETCITQNKSEHKIVTEGDDINTLDKPTSQTADLISSIARNTEAKQAAKTTDDCSSKMPHVNDMKNDCLIDMPSQELGLGISKITRSGTEIHDERNFVKRSDLSAFTRCKT